MEGRAAGGTVITAQHLLEITASLLAAAAPPPAIVGRAEHRKSPLLEAHAFKQNWEKSRWDQLRMKETALFAHPSKGQTGPEQG